MILQMSICYHSWTNWRPWWIQGVRENNCLHLGWKKLLTQLGWDLHLLTMSFKILLWTKPFLFPFFFFLNLATSCTDLRNVLFASSSNLNPSFPLDVFFCREVPVFHDEKGNKKLPSCLLNWSRQSLELVSSIG